jgi:TolB-like protein
MKIHRLYMSYSYVLALFILIVIHHSFLLSQQQITPKAKLNIAVMDFDAREGLSKGEAATLSDVLNSELIKSDEFTIVDRSRIKAILTEQGFQQSEACSQVECVVEAGKILKVEKMFVGVVGKIGKIYNINIQLIDIATARIERNISRQHSGEIEELATDVIPDMAAQMIREMTGKEIKVSSSSMWYYYVGAAVLVGGGAVYYLLRPKEETKSTAQQDLPGLPALP